MPKQVDFATRLRLLSGEVKAVLSLAQAAPARDELAGAMRHRLPQWVAVLDAILAEAEEALDPAEFTTRDLLVRALSGADIDVDGVAFSLHDITQLAAALRPGASLTVRNSEGLTPIEQTSIWTIMPGQVRFA